jgi:RNA polymerase sigma-70 factor (ECF subfamily)
MDVYLNQVDCNLQESKEQVIEELLKDYHQKIYLYCYNILRNPYDAEDATQEVFLKAIQSSKLLEIDNKSAWLYKIAYHHCLNKVKRRNLIEFIPFMDTNRSIEETESCDFELSYILSKLKPKERALLVLRIVEDKGFAEIATILEISSPTVRKRFERVKSKVQKIIERRMRDE